MGAEAGDGIEAGAACGAMTPGAGMTGAGMTEASGEAGTGDWAGSC